MPKSQPYLEAEKKIEEALQSGATELDLRDMQLTELPELIGQLKQLRKLDLGHKGYPAKDEDKNRLTALPDSLGQLTQLTELNLSSNKLTTLPASLGQLTQLTDLDLSGNQLTVLPDSLGQLIKLKKLNLNENRLTKVSESIKWLKNIQELLVGNNKLTDIPEWIVNLSDLEGFALHGNRFKVFPNSLAQLSKLKKLSIGKSLTSLPEWIDKLYNLEELWIQNSSITEISESIGKLVNLRVLHINGNQLITLPLSLARLEKLKTLSLQENPLNPALQSAYDQGLDAVKAYLRSLENAEPLYEAKLVLVGEGNVGKTTLLKALKSEKGEGAPRKDETTTHGVEIDIHGLKLPHPNKDGVEIQLNAWDFGGQDVYRVTHQFFFSRRSLYLLVWEPRRGVQQGQVEDWLNMIRLRVGDAARVLIVSTHCKTGERIARIDKPVFLQQYGDMIAGFYEVDSLVRDEATGEMVGIAELKKVIAAQAAGLEQMGMGFNRDWKSARNELIAHPEPRIPYTRFAEICAGHGLSQIDTETLAHLMHDLGYIVHYSDDEKLRDDMVLKPQWLTKAIGFVLEDRLTQDAEGILPDARLTQVWHDHPFPNEPRYDSDLYPFFLRLMEKFEVSYRLPEERHASLVAQHVPQVRPDLPWLPEQEPFADLRRIAMICAMEDNPDGLVPWMIVRTHDYAVEHNNHHLHWQKGMFLNHGVHGEAMLEQRGREFHVYAQADWPEYFMNVIQHTLQKLIIDNWPGMKDRYRFMVPCPEVIDGQSCKGRFNINGLRQFLAEGDAIVRCQECSKKQSIVELLFGFEERDMSVQLREIKEQLAGMDSRIANYFMATMSTIADEAKRGPRLFTFRHQDIGFSPKQLSLRSLEVQLWCEAEGCQHPVIESGKGVYSINQPQEWILQVAPYANFVLNILRTVMPVAAPAFNTVMGSEATESLKDHLDLAKAIIDKLPATKITERALLSGKMLSESEQSGILALHALLNELDPTQARFGLHRVATYTGDYRWLCKYHYDAWQSNIPDVIELSNNQYVEKATRYDAILVYTEADLDTTNNLHQLLIKRNLLVSQKSINELMKLKNNEIRAFIKSGRSFAFVISNEMLARLSEIKKSQIIFQLNDSDIPIVATHRSLASTQRGVKEFFTEAKDIDLSFGYRSEQIDKWEYWITGETPPKTKGMTWIDWLFGGGFEEDLPYLTPEEKELSLVPTRIRLRNIRSFVDTGIVNLNKTKETKRHTLLLGDNSAGKSTILQCIALASLGSEKANAFGTIGTSPASYLRHEAKTGYIEVEFQIDNISVESPFNEDTFVVGLKIEKGENRFETMRTDLTLSNWNADNQLNILRARTDDQFGFICGYGPWRTLASDPKSLWSEAQIPVVDRIMSLFDSNYILGHPDVIAKMLVGDFSNFRNAPKENKDKVFLHKMDELICKLLPNTNRRETDNEFTLEMNNTPISIQTMSDGYRSIMSIVGHLLYHSLSRKQWQGDPSDISGTIIIDEIDLHLHPAWQRFVFSSIRDAFPNLYIIASSHSPMVAGSISSESVRIMRYAQEQNQIIQDVESIRGWSADQILTSALFDLPTTRDTETEELLLTYAQKLNDLGPENSEVQELGKRVSKILSLPGEGVIDQKTHYLLDELLKQKFASLSPEMRKLVLAKAGLMIAK